MTTIPAIKIKNALLFGSDTYEDVYVSADESGSTVQIEMMTSKVILSRDDLAQLNALLDGAEDAAESARKDAEREREAAEAWPPDWSAIPGRFKWAAADPPHYTFPDRRPASLGYAYADAPPSHGPSGWAHATPSFLRHMIGYVNLPSGITWDQSLCQRPGAAPDIQATDEEAAENDGR